MIRSRLHFWTFHEKFKITSKIGVRDHISDLRKPDVSVEVRDNKIVLGEKDAKCLRDLDICLRYQ